MNDNNQIFFLTHLVCVEVAAALLLTASECWFWEVEVDALVHLEGTVVVRAGQEASLEVVQGQHVVEIYLVSTVKDLHQKLAKSKG